MKLSAFARLCSIDRKTAATYASQGLVAYSAPMVVDPAESLRLLAGRLNEGKRQAALAQLSGVAKDEAAPPVTATNARVATDELKRDKIALELAERAGDLIPLAEVEAAALDAIQAMQSAFDVESRATADQLAIDLGLTADRSAMLLRRLRSLSIRARARFSAEMAKIAGMSEIVEADTDETKLHA